MTQQDYNTSPDFVKAADLFFSNLRAENWQTYNVDVAKAISTNASILLCLLSSKYKFYSDSGRLVDHAQHGKGWFYLKHEDVEEMTGLTRREQDTAIQKLKDLKIIDCITFGLPNKRHFRIYPIALYQHIVKKNSAKLAVSAKLDRDDTENVATDPIRGKPVCTNPPNCIGGFRQTGHIYNPQVYPEQKEPVRSGRAKAQEKEWKEPPPKLKSYDGKTHVPRQLEGMSDFGVSEEEQQKIACSFSMAAIQIACQHVVRYLVKGYSPKKTAALLIRACQRFELISKLGLDEEAIWELQSDPKKFYAKYREQIEALTCLRQREQASLCRRGA